MTWQGIIPAKSAFRSYKKVIQNSIPIIFFFIVVVVGPVDLWTTAK
jgi:hypothetical protein